MFCPHNGDRQICNDCFSHRNLIKCESCLETFIDNTKEIDGCEICEIKKETNFCCEELIQVRKINSKFVNCKKCNLRICKQSQFKCRCSNIICKNCVEISFNIYHNGKETCGSCEN